VEEPFTGHLITMNAYEKLADKYKILSVDNLLGLNLDLSDEKVPPNEAVVFTNMKIGTLGVPETVNGCTRKKAFNATYDSAKKLGAYLTRGEDYIAVYHDDNAVRLWTYPDYALYATLSQSFTEATWFANHAGELWVGNMAEGMYRWRPGHEAERRGSAPEDIIAEPYEEGEASKIHTEWKFAYDYELNGGRSALSRSARVRLFHDTHKVKLTVDTPPEGSKGRRVYASYYYDSDSDGTNDAWTNWYFVYEEDNNDTIEIILDEELTEDREITDATKYTEDTASSITPQAKFGISYGSRIWIGYTVDSPTKVQFSEVGRVYFNSNDFFDLGEPITNLWGFQNKVIATTLNKIWLLSAEPHEQHLLEDAFGAYENSVKESVHGLEGICGKGIWIFDGTKIQIIEKISSVDFSGLEKSKRYFLYTSQQDFELGTYENGISSDYIPGAISLQPNLREMLGLEGILDWCLACDEYFSTSITHDEDYYAQPFIIPGSTSDTVLLKSVVIRMRADSGAEDEQFVGSIRADDSGKPNINETLATWSREIALGPPFRYHECELSETLSIAKGTRYWITIPAQGGFHTDWQIYSYTDPNEDYYPGGKMVASEDGGENWSEDFHNDTSRYMTFYLKGTGDILVSNPYLSGYVDALAYFVTTSKDRAYAQRFRIDADCATVRGELLVNLKTGSPDYPTIKIHYESVGAPSVTWIATASNFTEEDDILRFDFDTQSLESGTWYWLVIGKVGDTNNNWRWGSTKYKASYQYAYKDNGTWTAATDASVWCKIFATDESEDVEWALTGVWTSDTMSLQGANDDFEKIYCRKMVPAGSTATIEKREKISDSWGSWTEISSFPNTVSASTTDLELRVTLELGIANYTPIVDSLFVTYTKDGDSGDLLHVGIVNGEYWISKDDANADSSDTFTLVHDKFGNWHKLSECFYDYLQMEENITLGIGKNPTETYKHIYRLDDPDVSVWYSGDSTTKDIDTEWESGWILYDYFVKHYRKLWMSFSGDSDEILYITIGTSGGEYSSEDNALYSYPTSVVLEGTDYIKDYYISLPTEIQGKWLKISITGEGVDWRFHRYELHYWEKPYRNISISSAVQDTVTVRLANTTSVTNPQTSCFYGSYLFVGFLRTVSDCYIRKYLVNLDGSLTLLATATITDGLGISQIKVTANYVYVAYGGHYFAILDHDLNLQDSVILGTSSSCALRMAISDDENHAWVSHNTAQDVYYFDISDKAAISASVDALTSGIYFELMYTNNYLIVSYLTTNKIGVYDVSAPATVPYSATKEIATKYISRMVLGSDVNKIFYAGTASTNGPGIIDISTLASPSVTINDDDGNFFGREIARKGQYLFVLHADSDVVRVIDMGAGYDSLTSESSLSTVIGDYTANVGSWNSESELAFDGHNLLAYCSIESDLIYVFRIYGV